MSNLINLEFNGPVNLPLPILKSKRLVLDKSLIPKHFFSASKTYNTNMRVCNGHHRPISKTIDLSKFNDKWKKNI